MSGGLRAVRFISNNHFDEYSLSEKRHASLLHVVERMVLLRSATKEQTDAVAEVIHHYDDAHVSKAVSMLSSYPLLLPNLLPVNETSVSIAVHDVNGAANTQLGR